MSSSWVLFLELISAEYNISCASLTQLFYTENLLMAGFVKDTRSWLWQQKSG